jgi:hypothetical protein
MGFPLEESLAGVNLALRPSVINAIPSRSCIGTRAAQKSNDYKQH